MSPPALCGIVRDACNIFAIEAEIFDYVPSMTITELSFGIEVRAIVEQIRNVGGAVGFVVGFGDFESFVAGHWFSPFADVANMRKFSHLVNIKAQMCARNVPKRTLSHA